MPHKTTPDTARETQFGFQHNYLPVSSFYAGGAEASGNDSENFIHILHMWILEKLPRAAELENGKSV